MRRWSLMVLATVLLPVSPAAGQVSWEVVEEGRWCERDMGGRNRVRHCETREAVFPAVKRLDVNSGTNGGIRVFGWDRDRIRVAARVWGDAPGMDQARRVAGEVRLDVDDGRIRAAGPRTGSDEGWGVSFEIMVPHEIDLRLGAHNGGISVEGVRGALDLETVNGGVDLIDLGGDVRARTTNGGLDIELTGDTWEGRGLVARTTNGRVTIRVPEDYSAEIETGTVNGGIEVDFPVMVEGRITRRLTITLGDGGPRIRATTTNGGVSVERW